MLNNVLIFGSNENKDVEEFSLSDKSLQGLSKKSLTTQFLLQFQLANLYSIVANLRSVQFVPVTQRWHTTRIQ